MSQVPLGCMRGLRSVVKVLTLLAFIPAIILLFSSSAGSGRENDNNRMLTVRNLAALGHTGLDEAASIDVQALKEAEQGPVEAEGPEIVRPCSQPERLARIKEYCDAHPELKTFTRHPMSGLDRYHVFMVDEKHKLLFCAVPKAAVTMWRTMFLQATGKVNETKEKLKPYHNPYLARMGLKYLYNYTAADQDHILKTYFKFMSVRHPVERALSSYMDKFVYSELEFPILQAIDYINQNYRDADDQITLPNGRQTVPSGVSFPEFVRMANDEQAPYNIHWDSVIHICHPCVIQYDYIVKTETMPEDAPYILEKLSTTLKVPLTLQKIHTHRNAIFGEDEENPYIYTKSLPEMTNLTTSEHFKFAEKYSKDMAMFGYKYRQEMSEINCGFDKTGRANCC